MRSSRSECQAVGQGVSGQSYALYQPIEVAHAYYALALRDGLVRQVRHPKNPGPYPTPVPPPEVIPSLPLNHGTVWLVCRGRKVGIFDDW